MKNRLHIKIDLQHFEATASGAFAIAAVVLVITMLFGFGIYWCVGR